MKDIKFLGIHGKAYSGKSTISKEMMKIGFHPMAFASPVKEMVNRFLTMLGFSTKEIYDFNQNKDFLIPGIEKSVRELWQTLGTDWGRNLIDEDSWIMMAENEVNKFKEMYCRHNFYRGIVFEDVRFDNEAEFIRDKGGLIVHLVPERELKAYYNHESEAGIEFKDNDLLFNNDHGVDELITRIELILEDQEAA